MSERIIVLSIQWRGGGETFGPWTPREDGSHLDEIAAFLKRWHVREGKPEASFMVSLVTAPESCDEQAKART